MFGLASIMKSLKNHLVISLITLCSSTAIAGEVTLNPAKREGGLRMLRRTLSNSEDRLETAITAEEYLDILESIALCEYHLLERCKEVHGEQECTNAFKDSESDLLKKYVTARLDRAKKAQMHASSAASKVREQVAPQPDTKSSATPAKATETKSEAKK